MQDTQQQLIHLLKQAKQQLIKQQKELLEPIAVIGMACRFPGAKNLEIFWDNLCQAKCFITPIPADRYFDPVLHEQGFLAGFIENVFHFDPSFFDISEQEALYIDPQQRLILQTAYAALVDAGYSKGHPLPEKTAVLIGTSGSEYGHLCLSSQTAATPYSITGNSLNAMAGRLAYFLGLHGPAFAIDSACSSSLVAVDIAITMLRAKQIDMAIVGGVNLLLSSNSTQALLKTGVISTTYSCLPFLEQANGMVRGEGCGVVILKRQTDAVVEKKSAYAIINASGVNQDGKSAQLTAPNSQAQQQLLKTVLQSANLNINDLVYLEAHGTGTTLGDPLELEAIHAVYGQRKKPLYIGSLKANIGHLEAAAGIAGFIKAALILHYGIIPPFIQLDQLTKKFDWQHSVLTISMSVQVLAEMPYEHYSVGVSSFGFSGTNAHIILSPIQRTALETKTISSFTIFNEKEYRLTPIVAAKPKLMEPMVEGYRQTWVIFPHKILPMTETKRAMAVLYLPDFTSQTHQVFISKLVEPYITVKQIFYTHRLEEIDFSPSFDVIIVLPDYTSTHFAVDQLLQLGESLFQLAQFLSKYAEKYPFNLIVISIAAQYVFDDQTQCNNLLMGGVWELFRAFHDEYPLVSLVCIDLENLEQVNLVQALMNYAQANHLTEIAYRDNCCYGMQLQRIEIQNSLSVKINYEGVYIITGGNGDIGQFLLLHLAEQGAQRLVVLSRRKLDAIFVKRFKQQYPACYLSSRQVDITNFTQLEQVVQTIKTELGPIVAVYHLAGNIIDGLIQKQKITAFVEALKAKVLGAWYLHRLTLEEPLQEFVMFSSASTYLGGYGQCAYRVANACLTQLAYYRKSQRLSALSIAWGAWKHTRVLQSPLVTRNLLQAGMQTMHPTHALVAMSNILQQSLVNIGVFQLEWSQFFKGLTEQRSKEFYFSALRKSTATREDQLLSTINTDDNSLNKSVTDLVLAAISRVLPEQDVTHFDYTMPLERYGLNSLAAIDLTDLLATQFNCQLPAGFLYSHTTIVSLITYFENKKNEKAIVSSPNFQPQTTNLNLHLLPKNDAIAIIGIACRFPGDIETIDAFWQCLMEARSVISINHRSGWQARLSEYADSNRYSYISNMGLLHQYDYFDAEFFNISPREAVCMDPQQKIALETAWRALENAQVKLEFSKRIYGGIFIGAGSPDFAQILNQNGVITDTLVGTGSASSILAGRLAYYLNWNGPAAVIDTACSSSLVALHQACQALKNGECDIALAGGVNLILSPITSLILAKSQALSPHGRCAAFSTNADGYVRSEGCAFVVLKSLALAERDRDRIYAVIESSAVNQDGRSQGITAPNGIAQQEVMQKALQNANLQPEQIAYIETHGTGTPMGDQIEIESIFSVYGDKRTSDRPLYIGALKANMGHMESVAGVAGAIKAALMLYHQKLLPQMRDNPINAAYPIYNQQGEQIIKFSDQCQDYFSEKRPVYIGVSSFGFSGTNAHIILSRAAMPESQTVCEKFQSPPRVFKRKKYPVPGYEYNDVHHFLAPVKLPDGKQIYQVPFTDHFPFQLHDHRLYEETVVPGAFYLVILMQLFQKLHNRSFILSKINFTSPLILTAESKAMLQLHIHSKKFEIFAYLHTEESPIARCIGEWELSTVPLLKETELFNQWLEVKMNQISESASDYYHFLQQQHVHLGKCFQGIQHIWRYKDTVITKIDVNENDLAITAGAFDSIFQTIGLCLPREQSIKGGVRIPFEIEAIALYQELELPFYTMTLLNKEHVSNLTEQLSHDIHVFSEERKLLLSVQGLKTILVTDDKLRKNLFTRNNIDTYYWQLQPAAITEVTSFTIRNKILIWDMAAEKTLSDPLLSAKQSGMHIYSDVVAMLAQIELNRQKKYHTYLLVLPPQHMLSFANETQTIQAFIDKIYLFCKGISVLQAFDLFEVHIVSPLNIYQFPAEVIKTTSSLLPLILLGSLKTLSLECTGLAWYWHDYAQTPDINTIQYHMAVVNGSNEHIYCYQNGQRFVPRLKRFTLNSSISYKISPNDCYVIIGATSQIAQALIPLLIQSGAKKIALIQRTSSLTHVEFTEQTKIYLCDTMDLSALMTTFDRIEMEMGSIAAVFNLIGRLSDGLMLSQTAEQYSTAALPKIRSAWYLHQVLMNRPHTHLILFSSAAAVFGGMGQGSYAGANQYLHGLALWRRAAHLPTTVIAWGDWLLENALHRHEHITDIGMQAFTPEQAYRTLLQLMPLWSEPIVPEAAFFLDWEKLARGSLHHFLSKEFNDLLTIEPINKTYLPEENQSLAHLPVFERTIQVQQSLIQLISRVLNVKEAVITLETVLSSLGIESISSLEIREGIYKKYQVLIPVASLFKEQTVVSLTKMVLDLLGLNQEISNEVDISLNNTISELNLLLDEEV